MKEMANFIVTTHNMKNDSYFPYYQLGKNAQDAVDRVRSYADDNEVVVEVAKVVKGWK